VGIGCPFRLQTYTVSMIPKIKTNNPTGGSVYAITGCRSKSLEFSKVLLISFNWGIQERLKEIVG